MTEICLEKNLPGSILDIGGGGEGVLGRVYGKSVTAIDCYQAELDEAPDCCEKLCMDARELRFADASFDHVTFFYSLMFMDTGTREKTLSEAARVLRRGGSIAIWDAEFDGAYPEPYSIDLKIHLPAETITTTYGVLGQEMGLRAAELEQAAQKLGLQRKEKRRDEHTFSLIFKKK